ncbi:hypothetical protein LPJ61_000810 [Coemansia biformis]|uniref:Peptidase S1 domain-containing protein n=1 Tax=Coemansia biformis TaxID=1286918 RepID=A0A9W7YHM4_9FUNG|nr:hypothetical protein LPJ61_000810 [Coemansia biformis]
MVRLVLVAALALAGVLVPRAAEGSPLLDVVKRIYNGQYVPDSEAPYAVSVYKWKPDGNGGICGGTLISDRHVVTAAHCLTSVDDPFKDTFTVKVGYNSQYRDKQTQVKATKVTIHSDYGANNDDKYDIAILEIPAIKFGQNAQRMLIDNGKLDENQPLLAVGWGRTESDNGLPNRLKKATIIIGSPGDCKKFKSEFDTSNGPRVCALKKLTPGKGICMGDSGSGVSVDRGGTQYFAGLGSRIVFFGGSACGSADSASFFVHIASQLDFITRTTGLTREYLLGSGSKAPPPDPSSDDDSDSAPPDPPHSDDAPKPSPHANKDVATVTKTVYLIIPCQT